MNDHDRRDFGAQAEQLAVNHLKACGYRIRDRNVPCKVGELDIVAEKDGVLAVVEVRMTSSDAWGGPSETVMRQKQRRVVKATLYYLQQERLRDACIRFDVISVLGRGPKATLEHIENAFDAGF
jgi:putative endonuclease